MSDAPDSVNPWEASQAQMAAFVQNLPQILEAYRAEIAPTAEAQANADVAGSEKYAESQANLYQKWAPLFAQIGRDQYSADQLNAAETERNIANRYGGDLVRKADEYQRLLDPEFYKNREVVAAGGRRLLDAMDPTQLSGAEREEVSRALGRQGFGANDNILKATSDAMTFGSALQNKQSQYGALLGQVAQTLPTLRSGITGFEVATRRPLMSNSGTPNFLGAQMGLGSAAGGLSSNFLNSTGNFTNIWQQNEANLGMNPWEQAQAGGKVLGNIIGGIAKCWVAREVYGPFNPKWLLFREWLTTKAPTWLHDLYCYYGPAVAWFIKDKPALKNMIRRLMDQVI